jgi:hypothetical protein
MVEMAFDKKTGRYRCEGGQYATGGDEATTVHAGWNYDDQGGRRPMVFHQTVAWGMDAGLPSFVDTLVMRRVWDAMPADQRTGECVAFLKAGLARNPYAMAVVEAAIADAPDAKTAKALADAFDAAVNETSLPDNRRLYGETVRDLAHARVLALSPSGESTDAAAMSADPMR